MRGNVGYKGALFALVSGWVAWKDCMGCVAYVCKNIFYVGQHFTWVMIFTWVEWLKDISACINFFFYLGQNFLCGSNFCLRESIFFEWVSFYFEFRQFFDESLLNKYWPTPFKLLSTFEQFSTKSVSRTQAKSKVDFFVALVKGWIGVN